MSLVDDELLTKMAVYWPPSDFDEDGERSIGTAVERQCHWEDKHEEAIDAEGKTFITSGQVFLKEEVTTGGWLWLSTAKVSDASGTALAAKPSTPPNKQIIRAVQYMPDIDDGEVLYKALI